MKSATSTFFPGYWLAASIWLLALLGLGRSQSYDDLARSLYGPQGPNKGGWRPIVTSGSSGPGLVTYNIANVRSASVQPAQKAFSSPGTEKRGISSHRSGYIGDYHGSSSTRPLVTRDINKLTTIPQGYKTSHIPLSSINYNAPINSYVNPFALNGNLGINTYKIPSYQFDNKFIRHQQPINSNHRPVYNSPQGQHMFGKILKNNHIQSQIMQQIATNNQYHQTLQAYQNNLKKPLELPSRLIDNHSKPTNNVQKAVNPHDSLSKQTKAKTQNIAPVTYKPPLGSHIQQFGLQEESFGPIPSSILGSFSSFGHASVKAREPNHSNIKTGFIPTGPPKNPSYVSNETFGPSSTIRTNTVHNAPKEPSHLATSNQNSNLEHFKNEFTNNLVPPPHTNTIHYENYSNKNYAGKNFSSQIGNAYSSTSIKNTFIPSPPDPLNKFQISQESSRFPSIQFKQNQNNFNQHTKRPVVNSFFDSTLSPITTTDPFEPQSTNAIPEHLLVQLPPPYTSFNPFGGHSVKIENTNHKDKYQAFSSVNHNNSPGKYKDDTQFFPPRGQVYFDTKYNTYQTNSQRTPTQHKYEVTEAWGPSGEGITQPTLHSWLNPSQSYNHYNSNPNPLKTPYQEKPKQENQILSQPYFPASVPSKLSESYLDDVTTVYSTISDKNQNSNYLNNLENALSSSIDAPFDKKKPDSSFSSPSSVFSSQSSVFSSPASTANSEVETIATTSENYDEVTTRYNYNSRRKPSRYRVPQDTSTASSAALDEDFTTRFETFKEHVQETENDLQINDLPTIPPGKFFKRPALTTPTYDSWNEDATKKRNKNRRRRPTKLTTTEEPIEDTTDVTELPPRGYKYKTTSPPEVEEVTKPLRPKYRFSHKTRTPRPTSQTETTSSVQPTMLPTVPVTLRPKLHSRIRTTTLSPLDFEDLSETTTIREPKTSASVEQSSIMKIAKDHHIYRSPSSKYSPTGIGIFSESPDYSHKQDEKDTPTSDISINTSENKYSENKYPADKYSAQKLRDSVSNEDFLGLQVEQQDTNQVVTISDMQEIPTSPTEFENKTKYPQDNQSPQGDQLLPEHKPKNRGSTKSESNLVIRNQVKEDIEAQSSKESEVISTTPMTNVTKSSRVKNKSSKYDTNRPRFSVKDYRNRLNQYTSSSTTEKPSGSSDTSRHRFPNRSRFPSFKDPFNDKTSELEQSASVEQPRKKFMPKDPRHKSDESTGESLDNNIVSNVRTPPSQRNETSTETKPRIRGSLRRDPNRKRITTSTEVPLDQNEKQPSKPLSSIYTNLKRPGAHLRKRVQIKNVTLDTSENIATEPTLAATAEGDTLSIDSKASTEKSTSETAIMKIAKEERKHPIDEVADSSSIDPSQRVADLTLAASKEYNSSGLFKSVSPNARRVPDYFTIATDDPILPIEAFFPQLNQKKES